MANDNQTVGDESNTPSASSTQGDTPASAQVSTSSEHADSSSLSSFTSADIPMTNASAQTQDSSPPPQYLSNAESITGPINTATEMAITAPASPALFANTEIEAKNVVGAITATSYEPQPFYLNGGVPPRSITSIISIVRPSPASAEIYRLAAYYDARAREFRRYRRCLAIQCREPRHRRRGAWDDDMSEDPEYEAAIARYNVPSGVDIGLGEVIELSGRDADMLGWY